MSFLHVFKYFIVRADLICGVRKHLALRIFCGFKNIHSCGSAVANFDTRFCFLVFFITLEGNSKLLNINI